MSDLPEKKDRIQFLDAARGICVVLMVIHHFLLDLVEILGAPEWLFTNPVFDILHYIFAGGFIFISGISSKLSRSNIKRGIKVLVIAMLITLVTWMLDSIILFGVLHLLGTCMLLYGLTRKVWDSLDRRLAPVLYVLLLVISALIVHACNSGAFRPDWLWPLGVKPEGFFSADYFPIFPWVFVFLAGTWASDFVIQRKLPAGLYTLNVPFFPEVGRRALLIYVIHQPVLYGITYAIGYLSGILV